MIGWTITIIIGAIASLMFWVADLYRKAEEQRDENKKLAEKIEQLTREMHELRRWEATGLSSITRRFLHHKHGKCGDAQVIVPEDIDYDLYNEEQN